MLTPNERLRELAIRVAKERAEHAVKLTTFGDGEIWKAMRDAEVAREAMLATAGQIAALVRTAQVTVTFPQLYLGQGDGDADVQTPVPPFEAAGIFFPGSTPSAIPADNLPTDCTEPTRAPTTARPMTPTDLARGDVVGKCNSCGTPVSVHGSGALAVGYVTDQGLRCGRCCDAVAEI